ncbi:L-lactate permease [Paraburkholderia sabiae]|uniref:L-lactate permease n=1 Tax=Paraburkholderia sabiae TaxID=273251 RepID=A0ABU9QKS4_9BURK|nr:L-lactate permease [Paraburkholderia sabiae]WJZ76511.1 L-lactate permease [Paraburkholderia sabiae]CAD6560293.1 L-lactate permease [Paraburkholderia sabiae]
MYHQIYNPLGQSIGASAAAAALPLVVLFVLLGIFKVQARWAALCALLCSLAVAVFVYQMPYVQTASTAALGASTGFFPIIWIGINAIWVFKLTQTSGHDVVLRNCLSQVSPDTRVQAVLIAFCFGGLLESLAGGGAPVAICAVMLIAVGLDPVKAAAICLLADTSPVAFGSLGLPISLLSKVTSLPVQSLSMMVGRQTPLLAMFVPLILIVVADGKRGVKEVWPLALLAGAVFASAQCIGSAFLPLELVDIVSALSATGAALLFLKVWQPRSTSQVESKGQLASAKTGEMTPSWAIPSAAGVPAMAASAAGVSVESRLNREEATFGRTGSGNAGGAGVTAAKYPTYSALEIFRALAPYLVIIGLVALMQVKWIGHAFGSATSSFDWPFLDIMTASGKHVSTKAKFEWLASAGSIVLLAGLIVGPILGLSFKQSLSAYKATLHQLRWAVFTVCCVVGVAYVMNYSGQVITLGIFAANAGPAFAFVSPVLGWIATALTGSDTSANALFGVLQTTTAQHTGLSPILLAAANSSGGVVGKAISPQNLAIAAVAVGMAGKEGLLFRRVFGWTLLMIVGMSILVYLQSTNLLGWMVP